MEQAVSRTFVKPYRLENDTAHFTVSEAEFIDFAGQLNDALSFLQTNAADVRLLMSQPNASGVLDFAIEYRAETFQSNAFPSALVQSAGVLGLALELSHYPGNEASRAAP